MKVTKEDLNKTLLQTIRGLKRGVLLKNKIPVWAFSLPFWKVARDDGAIWYYCTLCHCVEPGTLQETIKGVIKYTKKIPPAYGTMSFIDM